jgi:hypothetical protein
VSSAFDPAGYLALLREKVDFRQEHGFAVGGDAFHPLLKPHQRDLAQWMVRMGRAALFASFGLGKTFIQLEVLRVVLARESGCGLIILPLGVRHEFRLDAEKLGIPVRFVRTTEEVSENGIYLTNYESVRDGKLDPEIFTAVSLDEASVLRSFGSKTYQSFLTLLAHVPYRFVATATPSPNAFKELIHYAGFLGVMDTGQALTRFFQRDSEKAGNLTLYPHMEAEFFAWLHSWAAFVQRPSDLGYSDEGYDLPPLTVRWHEVRAEDLSGGIDRDGQHMMLKDAALGLTEAAKEKRESIAARVAKMAEIVNGSPDDHFILWHDLEAERHAIDAVFPDCASVYGSLDLDTREERTIDFAEGRVRLLSTKPEISGSGCNFQRHCHRAIFLGIGYKFNDLIQAVHRIQRFLQPHACQIDLILCETEREVKRELLRKWGDHDVLTNRMSDLIREHGMSAVSVQAELARTIGVDRREVAGERYLVAHNDCVLETAAMEADSLDLIVTSIPFGNHYEYSTNYEDFGHNSDNAEFFRQMDFLTPELLRVLRPGRVAAIHVKDRIRFGNVTGLGMPSVDPFHADCIAHYRRHGFIYCGMITVNTDVVRENNQTYRLGWSEQCKDGSKMGVGSPEYVLLLRKLPSDTATAYADIPVVKSKTDYTRGRWQIDAHAFWRSSGDRFLTAAEVAGYGPDRLARLFPGLTCERVYDYREHVALAEALDEKGRLPSTFGAVLPGAHDGWTWHDVNRMRTLNGAQAQRNLVQHICLARGSLVLTRTGYVPIEDVLVGDEVLTHKGRWRPVTVKANTGVRRVVTVRAQGVPGLTLTPEHELWTRPVGLTPWQMSHARQVALKATPCWVRADHTLGSYVNLKLPPENSGDGSPLLTTREWMLVGRWIADGHRGARGEFVVSIGKAKLAAFEEMFGEFCGTRQELDAVQIRLRGVGAALRDVLEQCGALAGNKVIPPSALSAPCGVAKALLHGYLAGDGHYLAERDRWLASTVSKRLAFGLALLAQRAFDAIASVYAGRPEREHVIEGRQVHAQQDWIVCFDVPSDTRKNGRPLLLDDGAWKKVRELDEAGEAETWCLRVEEDESFTAEGLVVKNCPLQFDIVDRLIERFSNPGELVFDPFGGLFTVPYCAMKLGRRGRAVELNGEYFRDGVRHLREVEREVMMPTLFAAETEVAGSVAA